LLFFFQAEDGIRDRNVTGVQTCALPIWFVLRYRTDLDSSADRLPGKEGAFLACSFWMANALLSIGKEEEANELFERLLSLRNDVGLLAEEWGPRDGRQIGNFPQAFSHVPLVTTALNLADKRGGWRT